MSKELNQYLENQPIFMFKLVDGSTVIGRMEDIDTNDNIIIQDPQEVVLHESGRPELDMAMHKYMFLSDERTTLINLDKVISYSEANLMVKQFYSKSILRSRVNDTIRNKQNSYFSELINSFIDGLDNQDFRSKPPWPPEEDI